MRKASDADALPDFEAFEGFVEYLRALGFRVGIDHIIKLHRVVASLDEHTSPKDLELSLSPVFSTNADEQELFYRAFESYFSLFFGPPVVPPERLPVMPTRQHHAYRWAVAAVLAILAIVRLLFLWDSTGFSLQFGIAPLGSAPVVPGALYGQFRFQIPTMEWLPWLAMAVAGALCLIWHARPLWALDQTPEPFYQSGRRGLRDLFATSELREAALQLRRRSPSQVQALDIGRSIESTIRAQGNLHYVYRPRPSAPEYLILIDSAGPRDHQAIVFAELARRVAEENVHTSVWFYNGDPHFCLSENQRDAAYLLELRSRYQESVLVLMGMGMEMVCTTGEAAPWIPVFGGWRRRILLTPTPAETLQTWFVTAPPTPVGLAAAVAATEKLDARVSMANDWPVPAPWTGGSWKSLRQHLGPHRFAWLCGCAVYPELEWVLTMRMGEVFLGPAAWEPANILALATLPWFRSGAIPAHTRRKLAGRLSGADRCRAAEVVREYVAEADPATRRRSRRGRRVDLTAVRLDSPARFARWLASQLRQTVIVRSDQLQLGRISRLFWARLLRAAITMAICGLVWMIFERWPHPHRDATMNVPLPRAAPTAPPARERVPEVSPDRAEAQPRSRPRLAPPAIPFQAPQVTAATTGPQPEITPPPSIATPAVVSSNISLPSPPVLEPPPPQPPKPVRSISSLLGVAVELKYTDAKLYRFADFDALPSDVQRLFANTAPDKNGAVAYNQMKTQPAELAYLLNNLAKARVVLPDGRELISYFTGIEKGGYYSEVEADPNILEALNHMVTTGALSRSSVVLRPGIRAMYITRESGSDLRIGVRPTASRTGQLVLELHMGEGQGIGGALGTAIRQIRGIPNLISIYNRLVRQKLETGYRVGSACDVNGDGVIDVADMQTISNQAIGKAPALNDLNGDGVVDIIDVQLVTNALSSGSCPADIQPVRAPVSVRDLTVTTR